MKRALFVCFSLFLASLAKAQISYTTVGMNYTQNFDSMTPTGTTTPFGWFVGSGTGAFVSGTGVTPDTGTSTTSGHYNYGVAGAHSVNDRALGSKNDSGQQLDTEVHFINNTGFTLGTFTIGYTGEEWRNGGSGAQNSLVLQYSFNGTTWISLGSPFNFLTPVNSTTASGLDGNAAANRIAISGTYTLPTTIAPSTNFYLRFADGDESGKDDGVAVDDFTFSAQAVPEPSAYMLLGVGLLFCGQRFLRRRGA